MVPKDDHDLASDDESKETSVWIPEVQTAFLALKDGLSKPLILAF